MITFKVLKNFSVFVKSNWGDILITMKEDKSYFSTTSFFKNLQFALLKENKVKTLEEIETKIKYIDITHRIDRQNNFSLDNLFNKIKSPKILIINGFVSGIGDNLVGMTALEIFLNHYKNKFKSITIDIYNENILRIKETLSRYNIINEFLTFPQEISALNNYDAIIDMDDIHETKEFKTLPMVDAFLSYMGIEYSKIPSKNKRIRSIIDEKAKKDLDPVFKGIKLKDDSKLLLFQYQSSAKIRGITNKSIVIDKIKDILKYTDYRVMVFDDLDIDDIRVINVKRFSSDLDHFMYIIANSDYVLTTDSSTYHISDSLNIPTIALFTSIHPNIRTKYYPNIYSIYLPKISENPIKDMFDSIKPTDLEYVDGLWKDLDMKSIMEIFNTIKFPVKEADNVQKKLLNTKD